MKPNQTKSNQTKSDGIKLNVDAAMVAWPQVARVLSPPKSNADYRRLIQALDQVLDAGGADEKHPLAGLANALGELIEGYETDRMPMREIPVPDFLRELMRLHALKQSDLPEIGSQSVVSAILSGKRKLNVRQIAALRERFHLPADTLIP